ncbi:MAG: alkaline phosphatase D family protein [Planctomycetota bacterium]
MRERTNRRDSIKRLAGLGAGYFVAPLTTYAQEAPTDSSRPLITSGVASGDVTSDGGILWSRCDRPARMLIEVSTSRQFDDVKRIVGPDAMSSKDCTAKVRLRGFAPGTRLHYRVRFEEFAGRRRRSEWAEGSMLTAPQTSKDVTFVWSGDTAGQGFGIDPDRGGMRTYQTMLDHKPDFMVHSGDACYADGPFPSRIELDDGSIWSNIVTEGTSKVAESLEEFRANHRYNLMDRHVRRFNAETPVIAQWDDHETVNNWYPGEFLNGDDRYRTKSVSMLAARAKQAFLEYSPIRTVADGRQRLHRVVNYGPMLDLFFLDLRSFRGRNSTNRQSELGDATQFLGRHQLSWLKSGLKQSKATWKVICSDMPIGLVVGDGNHFENAANGDDGPPLGRELELASLFQFVKQEQIQNLVWITADVHYAASHYYDPNLASFKDFLPFWEFVSGPLHAGTFGPNKLDNTFGPQVKFTSVTSELKPNRPPSEGLQFFGKVRIEKETQVMTVEHYNRNGNKLWGVELEPSASA